MFTHYDMAQQARERRALSPRFCIRTLPAGGWSDPLPYRAAAERLGIRTGQPPATIAAACEGTQRTAAVLTLPPRDSRYTSVAEVKAARHA